MEEEAGELGGSAAEILLIMIKPCQMNLLLENTTVLLLVPHRGFKLYHGVNKMLSDDAHLSARAFEL
jgi:hypothetical protein